MDEDSQLHDLAGDIEDVAIVNSRNEHRVHLHDLLELHRLFDSFQLLVSEEGGGLKALESLALVDHVVIDLLSDLGIDGIHGDCDVADAEAIQLLNPVRQEQAVGADA